MIRGAAMAGVLIFTTVLGQTAAYADTDTGTTPAPPAAEQTTDDLGWQ
ncbi:hypothetical protein [Streptomyces chromofuscus]|uniref:Uncharacterized protein n=1 Tax=Streptomyces chromofuscus TaxID=42881 RepID=A0A7M2T7G4_STRCW|nr:hypothetical protein [Streptomyces chromofuscus]QOV44522.1 hypothetical protein IPT68_00195 [Streptomyces chromofuscus]